MQKSTYMLPIDHPKSTLVNGIQKFMHVHTIGAGLRQTVAMEMRVSPLCPQKAALTFQTLCDYRRMRIAG